jgi:hypothetical protein
MRITPGSSFPLVGEVAEEAEVAIIRGDKARVSITVSAVFMARWRTEASRKIAGTDIGGSNDLALGSWGIFITTFVPSYDRTNTYG